MRGATCSWVYAGNGLWEIGFVDVLCCAVVCCVVLCSVVHVRVLTASFFTDGHGKALEKFFENVLQAILRRTPL